MTGVVSVIIPARNAALTIERALASVLAQRFRPIEAIVVDDGSCDTTAEVVRGFANPAVRLIRLPQSCGAAAARNIGIEACSGEIVAFQDADDEWLPGKLEQQVKRLHSDPRLILISSRAVFISATGEELGLLFGGALPATGTRAWQALLARNTIATPTVVTWRRHLVEAGCFDSSLAVAEDQDMWIRLAMRGPLAAIEAPLVRVHASQNSLSLVGTSGGFRQQIEFTLPMIERYVAAKRDDMSPGEIRRIFAERWGRLGRAGYSYGHYILGLRLIIRAALLGFEPLQTVRFLLSATPPISWLKRLVRGSVVN
jgi:glycosyltransferase involved in cell wall biosynthesis